MAYEDWLKANAPTYMQDVYGQAWMGGIGATLDDYVAQYVAGALAAFPGYAPADALAALGDEMGIDRSPAETDSAYAARLRSAWVAWKLAGTPYSILAALWAQGYTNVVLAQQNGLAYKLTQTPTGVPANDLSVFDAATLIAPFTSMVTFGYSVPQGIPWWTIDNNPEFCSRFVVLFLNALPASWTNVVNPPTSGTAPTLDEVNRIRGVINKWRPAKATCVGFYAQVSGKMLGWDFTWGDPLGGVTVFFPTQ